MSRLYLISDVVMFSEQEVDVKQHQRLVKGKLQTVRTYDRTQDKGKPETQGERQAQSVLAKAGVITAAVIGAAFATVAGGAALIALKHNKVVGDTARKAIATTQQIDKNYITLPNRTQILAKDVDMTGKDGFIIAIGGFSREHGDHSFQLAKHLELEFPTKKVVVVDNKAFDIVWEGNRDEFSVNKFIKKSVALSADAHINGNDTAYEAARTIKMLNSSFPQYNKKIITASGSGSLATQMLEVNDAMGEKPISALALGSPRFGFSSPKKSKLTVITDPSDQMMGSAPLLNPGNNVRLHRPDRGTEPYDNWGEKIPINKAHSYISYTKAKASRSIIDDFMKESA